MPISQIAWDKQDVVSCDERGRATLGSEFAEEQVFVWVARTPEPEDMVDVPDDEKEVLAKMATWARENLDDDVAWFDLDAKGGVITDKYGEEYYTPYSLDFPEGMP